MEIYGNEKVCSVFYCKNCDYSTSKKSNYDKHILTAKHKTATLEIFGNSDDNPCVCKHCGHKYKTISGLWKHGKKYYDYHDLLKFVSKYVKRNFLNKKINYDEIRRHRSSHAAKRLGSMRD